MPNRPDFAIDLNQIINGKKKVLPGFVVKMIEKLMHVDYLNGFFVQGYEGVEFCTECLKYMNVKLEVEGLENVPDDGTCYTFVSNHPLGGIDGVAMGAIVGSNFHKDVKYLVNSFLMAMKGLAPICVPINKIGSQSRDLPRLIEEAFSGDNNMIVFPAGICSRKIKGKIQDLEWGKACVTKSLKYNRTIVPVHFIAENSPRFYRICNICKKLGIKFNLAMLFLPDELYRGRGKTFKVVIGKPLPPEYFDKSKTPYEWAQWLRSEVYTL